jgi:hypothetical protein
MLPALLLHEVVQFRRPVAGMLRSSSRDLVLAQLAPNIIAPRQRANEDAFRFMFFAIDKHRLLAPVGEEEKIICHTNRSWQKEKVVSCRRQWITTENMAICNSS